jgi:hypothetical protein
MFCVWGAVEVNIAIVSGNKHPQVYSGNGVNNAFLLGCCPLLRPIIQRIFPDMFPSAAVSSQRVSRPSNAIRLTTITKTDKAREADESSSTHQLADPEDGQLNDYMHDEVLTGVHTTIESKTNDWNSLRREEELELTGIHLRKETVVEVKRV